MPAPTPQNWPYDWVRAENRLDPEMIERQGSFLLHRALNLHAVVAFIGTGTSNAYGRVSWGELADIQIDTILRTFDFPERIGPADKPSLDSELANLIRRVSALSQQVKLGRDGPKIQLAMQLCEQIWELATHDQRKKLIEAFFLPWDFSRSRDAMGESGDGRGRELFRATIRAETNDEAAFVWRILRGSFCVSGAGIDDIFEERRRVPLTRFSPENKERHYLCFFDKSAIENLKESFVALEKWTEAAPGSFAHKLGLHRPLTPAGETLAASMGTLLDLSRATRGGDRLRQLVPPVRYFVVGLALDLLRWWERALGKDGCAVAATWIADAAAKRNELARCARGTIVDCADDPLYRLRNNLQIRRFITTNYDLEVERLFDDLGFRRSSASLGADLEENEIERANTLGARVRDILLRENTAVDLIDFAVHEGGYEAQLVHLHGRATDGDDIVVTERDYQMLYARESDERAILRDGLDVLFGGNPILFVGLGLSEGDILRPLREFLRGNLRRNRTIVALRAGDDEQNRQDSFTMEQFARYGVYVLHYGALSEPNSSRVGSNIAPMSSVREAPQRWLERFRKIQVILTDVCTTALAPLKENIKGGISAEQWSRSVDNALTGASTSSLAIPVLFDIKSGPGLTDFASVERHSGLIDKRFHARPSSGFVFGSDGAMVDIRFECAALHLIASLLTLGLNRVPELSGMLSQAPSVRADHRLACLGDLIEKVLRPAIPRIGNAIHTAALVARLEGLEGDWKAWWNGWLRLPMDRTKRLQFHLPESGDRTTWARHAVHEDPPHASGRDSLSESTAFFLRSLPSARAEDLSKRRIFLVAARRGAGRGKLFSELRHCADWMLSGGYRPGASPPSRYRARFFVNFSFSSEIASVWDALTAFLIEPEQANAAGTILSDYWNDKERLHRGMSRHAMLRDLLLALRDSENRRKGRLLLAFNAFDLLLEADGYPKQADIRAICDLLFGAAEEAKDTPIDLLLIVREDRVPLHFRTSWTPVSPDRRDKCPPTCSEVEILYEPQAKDGIRLIPEIVAGMHGLGVSARPFGYGAVPASHSPVYIHLLRPLRLPFRIGDDGGQPPSAGDPFHDDRTLERLRLTAESLDISPKAGRALRERIVQNRYIYTLCWHVFRQIEAWVDEERLTEEDARATARSALSDIILQATAPSEGLEDRVIDRILQFWTNARERESPPHRLAKDTEFQILVLRHLAVIGIPIEPSVLLLCPRIAGKVSKEAVETRRSQDLVETQSHQPSPEVQIINGVLEELASRGLAFVIASRKPNGALLRRYALHRLMQLHVYKQLGSQSVEPPEANYFSVSIYASQTRELPTLTAEAYSFINDVVFSLAGYPAKEVPGANPTRPRRLKGLRAAMGVARSLYSIGVVGRFADVAGLPVRRPPDMGYLEQHRLLVRFLLYSAESLEPEDGSEMKGNAWAPFYRDEIMWLYNEAGVFSCAQGHAQDAKALFMMALDVAREIEGVGGGPMRRRILLNAGLTAIDRGRLPEAERCFREVLAARATEDETIVKIASGYLALCQQLRGHVEEAEKEYQAVITALERLSRARPVSIFARNLGDLMRRQGRLSEALFQCARAVRAARSGGYEDVAMWAQLSEARALLSAGKSEEAHARIDDVERYADQMEMPSLTCEVLIVRAENLLAQGESTLAGQTATRALRIATLHGLRLRKIAAMDLLSQILHARGQVAEATRLRKRNVRYARSVGYVTLAERAEQLDASRR